MNHLNHKNVFTVFASFAWNILQLIYLYRIVSLKIFRSPRQSPINESCHFLIKSCSRCAKYWLVVLRRKRRTYVNKCVLVNWAGVILIFSSVSIVFSTVDMSTTCVGSAKMSFDKKIRNCESIVTVGKVPYSFYQMISTTDPLIRVDFSSWKIVHHP